MSVSRRDALKSFAAALVVPAAKAGPSIPPSVPKGPKATAKNVESENSLNQAFVKYGIAVNDRSMWVPQKAAKPAGLVVEDDVKVLLVHHSDSPNTYKQTAVPGILEGFRQFHMGPEKKWADIAYNFFVDRFGGVWEGRFGSLTSPIIGSASGGNQGHSQLVCLVGNFATEFPSKEMTHSLARVLSALSETYGLDSDPEATSTFVSRGSNRWAEGKKVVTRSIEGHRAMSMTSCPGDAAFEVLSKIRADVQTLRSSK
jgi:hypothetical protein